MKRDVREIWAADANKELIKPLTDLFPRAIRVGDSGSIGFSTQLDVISPESVYDRIDYKGLELTGEELYNATRREIAGGFKGGQQFKKDQVRLMINYDAEINPPEPEE